MNRSANIIVNFNNKMNNAALALSSLCDRPFNTTYLHYLIIVDTLINLTETESISKFQQACKNKSQHKATPK